MNFRDAKYILPDNNFYLPSSFIMGRWSIYHGSLVHLSWVIGPFIIGHFLPSSRVISACPSVLPFCMRIHPSYIFVITSVRESIHHAFNIAITFDITPKSNRGFPCRDSTKAFVLLCRPFWCFHTQTVVFFVDFSTFF